MKEGNTISSCWDCTSQYANYACKLEEQLDALRTTMEELKELKNDVERRVDIAKRQKMKPLDQVQGWLSRVEVMEAEVGGCCSKNCGSSYKLGKIAAKKLKEEVDQKRMGQFETVAEALAHTLGDERPSETTVGLEATFAKLWGYLGEDQVGIIGLCGMGGVGKTTLLSQINNQFVLLLDDIWERVDLTKAGFSFITSKRPGRSRKDQLRT